MASRPPRPGPARGGRGLRPADARASMTDEAAARVVTAPGGRWSCRPSTGSASSGRCPTPPRGRRSPALGVGVGRRRPAGGARPDPGRPGPVQPGGAGPAHPRRGRHRDRDRPPGGPGAAPRPALRPAAGPRRRAAAQHAHRPAGARPLRDRRPLRAGRGRRRDRRRLVRRVPAARAARRCSRSATSSATTPAPPRRWARCAACCAASATPAAARPPRCSPSSTGPSQGLALDTMATALVARLEQDDDDLRAGRTSAPLVQRRAPAAGRCSTADGKVVLLDDEPADLLLGVAPETHARGARHRPRAGRDGAALHRRPGRAPRPRPRRRHRRAVRRCCASAPTCRWRSSATGCSSGCSCPTPQDDVAMLAVRLHPQDEPRPRRPARRSCRRHRAVARRAPEAGTGAESAGVGGGRAGSGRARAGRRRPAPPSRATPTAPAAPRPARSRWPRPAAGPGPAARPGR